MNINEFDYYLPEDRIAQTPLKNRSDSKLMILDKKTGAIKHEIFKNIYNYLEQGDVLVLNDTKVIPARLIGVKEDTKAHMELLLLNDQGDNVWECLARPCKRLHNGTIISFGDGSLKAQVLAILGDGIVHVKLLYEGILFEILDKLGEMPLPPYIHTKLKDQNRYQTVYAKYEGSAAAPTAGLHFTNELLERIKSKGVIVTFVTLHVGLGTFRPVQEENILDHKMHSEFYIMNEDTAKILNQAKKDGRRVIAVGTTSCRTLETVAHQYNGLFKACSGNTDIFIYPGFKFMAIDALITNFHLPKSTLVMLVSALASKDIILKAYNVAIENDYRFFSFGDAMFIK
jgi:S-adenosylmethionine:tRNA ribosyltransferase-isomerase